MEANKERIAAVGRIALCARITDSMAHHKAAFAFAALLLAGSGEPSLLLKLASCRPITCSTPMFVPPTADLSELLTSYHAAGLALAQQPCVTPYQSAARNSELTFVAQAMQVSSTSLTCLSVTSQHPHNKLIMLDGRLMVQALFPRAGRLFGVSAATLDQARNIKWSPLGVAYCL